MGVTRTNQRQGHRVLFCLVLFCNFETIICALNMQATNENLPPNVIKQLARELKSLDETPPEGIKVGVNDDDFSTIFADIDGPGSTDYS